MQMAPTLSFSAYLGKSVLVPSVGCNDWKLLLPEDRPLARELPDMLEVECELAEHALDLVWFVLLDLEADVDLPALVAGTFALFVLASAVLWGDSE